MCSSALDRRWNGRLSIYAQDRTALSLELFRVQLSKTVSVQVQVRKIMRRQYDVLSSALDRRWNGLMLLVFTLSHRTFSAGFPSPTFENHFCPGASLQK